MLADLSEDCAKLVRLFDKQDVDAVHCMVHADDFIRMLHREYVEGAMWRRRGTYSDKIGELLRDEKMIVYGAGYVIMSVPTRREAIDVMAKVANVATAIQKGLETEFPTGGVTRLFGCFRVAAVIPPDQARASMDQLGISWAGSGSSATRSLHSS